MPAIVTFTRESGASVLLDGALADQPVLWNGDRRRLLESEIRYLAGTGAPAP